MKETLRSIGFDDKETDIYLALLKADKATVSELLKHTQIERRTIYDVLERLIQKGRVSYFEENNTRVYMAVSPEVILEDLKQKQNDFQAILPKLTSLQVSPHSAKVEILKGTKGLRSIFLEVINGNFDHVSFGYLSPLIYEERYARLVKQFLTIGEKKGLREKVIYTTGDPITKIKTGEYRSLNKEVVFPSPTLVYENVVTQYIYTDPITIIKITSKEVAETNMKYFKYFWKLAKKD